LKEKAAQRLIDGISRYGLENVSTLSKWVEIPVETARYMIWEELPKHRVAVRITVNLPRIGLGRWMLQITPAQKSYADGIDAFLKDSAGPMYIGRIIPDDASVSMLGIPFGEQYKLREQLAHLRSSSIIESYSLDEVEWMRDVSINPAMYDFKSKDWKFDWEDLDKTKEPLITPEIKDDQAPVVDYKDILILKELQCGVPRTLSKLSKQVGLDQHNLRYHYKTHVRRTISGYYLRLLPPDSGKFCSSVLFSVELQNEKSLAEARSVALRIPFTQKVWKTEHAFCWLAQCPGEHTSGMLRYINDKFVKIPGKLRVSFIDPTNEYFGAIPHTLFDEDKGMWKYEPKSALQIVKKQ
jgi:DNA-binding Lrp family transcriptional regulator